MKKIFFSLILLLSISFVSAQKTYILCGKLIHTKSGKIQKKQTIVVEGNKITHIHNGYVQPKSRYYVVNNLKKRVVMPGLIDMHVHIEKEFDAKTRLKRYIMNDLSLRKLLWFCQFWHH